MMAIRISDIEDGQKIKALDDIYLFEAFGKDDTINDSYNIIQITGVQVKNNILPVAKAGDIGVYNKVKERIEFSIENESEYKGYHFLDLEYNENRLLNEELFQLVD